MRWICWVFAPLAVLGTLGQATGLEPGGHGGRTCGSCEHHGGLSAPPCGVSFYGMTPGCCETPPSACDNAWAGYCDERAHWKSRWYRMASHPPQPTRPTRATCRSTVRSISTVELQPPPKASAPPRPRPPVAEVPLIPVPEAPLPPEPTVLPEPAGVDEPGPPAQSDEPAEPSALPPLPSAVSQDTTWNWDRLWQW